jgi:hypothetical protein
MKFARDKLSSYTFGRHSSITVKAILFRCRLLTALRFLQARILLLRPIMSRFCLDQTLSDASRLSDNLTTRVIHQCALFCVTTAQDVISTLAQFERQDGTIGLLPAWWYRIYYVYSAATILIVAKLRPDIFPSSDIKQSWNKAMSVLQAHEKFGQSARRCVAALNILSSKILHGTRANSPSENDGATVSEDTMKATTPTQSSNQPMGEFVDFSDLDLPGFSFDATDLSYLNLHAWELLNES